MADSPNLVVSLYIASDRAAADVQLAIMAALSDWINIVHSSVTNLDEVDGSSPSVTFVICPVRGLLRTVVDDDEGADAYAKEQGAVVVNWSADADHRGEVTV